MSRAKRIYLALAAVLLLAALLAVLLPWLGAVDEDLALRRSESIRQAVLAAALQCYVVEGVYPGALSYLEEGYGLMINHERYIVSYACYAANRPPEVMVLER